MENLVAQVTSYLMSLTPPSSLTELATTAAGAVVVLTALAAVLKMALPHIWSATLALVVITWVLVVKLPWTIVTLPVRLLNPRDDND